MKDLEIMPSALRSLANEIQSPDGIPAMCLRDAADLIEFLERQLAEANERLAQVHKDLGHELRDPYGTIWDECARLQRELAGARQQVAALETRHAATMLHTQAIVDDANALREQRDRLAEAVELGMQLEEPGNIWSVRPDKFQAFLKSAKMAFAAVKGGKDG